MTHLHEMMEIPKTEGCRLACTKRILGNGLESPTTHLGPCKGHLQNSHLAIYFSSRPVTRDFSHFVSSMPTGKKGTQGTRVSNWYLLGACHSHPVDTARGDGRNADCAPALACSGLLALVTTEKTKKPVLERIWVPGWSGQWAAIHFSPVLPWYTVVNFHPFYLPNISTTFLLHFHCCFFIQATLPSCLDFRVCFPSGLSLTLPVASPGSTCPLHFSPRRLVRHTCTGAIPSLRTSNGFSLLFNKVQQNSFAQSTRLYVIWPCQYPRPMLSHCCPPMDSQLHWSYFNS